MGNRGVPGHVILPAFPVVVTTATLVSARSAAKPLAPVAAHAAAKPLPKAVLAKSAAPAAYGKLGLSFEKNVGQADKRVAYLAHGPGYTLFLTADGAVLNLDCGASASGCGAAGGHVAAAGCATSDCGRMAATTPAAAGGNVVGHGLRSTPKRAQAASSPSSHGTASGVSTARTASSTATATTITLGLVGANPQASIVGQDRLPGEVNYLIGNDPRQWHTHVPTYAQVVFQNVYPGIDMVYHGGQGNVHLAGAGNVLLSAAPAIYQTIKGLRHIVSGAYHLLPHEQLGFTLGRYNHQQTLTIDPVLTYSSYLGGNGTDRGYAVAVDSSGDAYLTGYARSTNFPLVNPFQSTKHIGYDVFVSKLNPAGSTLLYSTYVGGNLDDMGYGIAVGGSGNATFTAVPGGPAGYW
jgi:hypothetical protein